MKYIIIVIILLLVVSSLVYLNVRKQPQQAVNEKEERFTGSIERITFNIDMDGYNYMIIDGKRVIFDAPMTSDENGNFDRSKWGTVQGFVFLQGPERTEDAKKYYGKEVEVYAATVEGFDSEGNSRKSYTLFGNKDYYIKLK